MAVKGGDAVRRAYKQLVKKIRTGDANKAVTEILITGTARASVITPVGVTSNLINSQFRVTVPLANGNVQGRAGYTANYAFFVHDPRFPMQFRKKAAEKEFLVKGFAESIGDIQEILRRNFAL
jgi:hypothetical protein